MGLACLNPGTCVHLGKSLSHTGQLKSRSTLPDWLKTTEVARNGGMYLKKKKKTASDVLCEAFVSFNTLSFEVGYQSAVKKYKSTRPGLTHPALTRENAFCGRSKGASCATLHSNQKRLCGIFNCVGDE